mmetsp:Transcript_81940/g.171459  ORF Transcript_81940/g.171459 Transcript_81940/m.171459 type:complete len:309 (-) Transcript_81940:185-1111(-)
MPPCLSVSSLLANQVQDLIAPLGINLGAKLGQPPEDHRFQQYLSWFTGEASPSTSTSFQDETWTSKASTSFSALDAPEISPLSHRRKLDEAWKTCFAASTPGGAGRNSAGTAEKGPSPKAPHGVEHAMNHHKDLTLDDLPKAGPNGIVYADLDVDGSEEEARELALKGIRLDGRAGGNATVLVTSEQDPHSGALAVDGSKSTYWASAYDPPEGSQVMMEVRLLEPKWTKGIRIDWEYPPMAYEVQAKEPGNKFETVGATSGNMMWDTSMYSKQMLNLEAIRIYMNKAHPQFGDVSGHKVFGIRGIDIL